MIYDIQQKQENFNLYFAFNLFYLQPQKHITQKETGILTLKTFYFMLN